MAKRIGSCLVILALAGVLIAPVVAADGAPGPVDRPVVRAVSEVAVEGITPDDFFAHQAQLHAWLITQVPAGVDKATVSVALTQRDRIDLETPYVAGAEATPMRVGVVKSLSERVGLTRGQSTNRRSKSLTSVRQDAADGGFVWATTISSQDAVAIRVHFEHFSIPASAEMYILSNEGEAYGPYVGTGPDGTGEFWSNSVTASSAIVMLRYYGAPDQRELSSLSFRITEVAHVALDFPRPAGEGGVAAFCTYNADCVENNECTSDPAVNDAKYAVAKMRWISGAFVYICSGGLLADTDGSSEIPYFLTANHCMSKDKDAENLEAYFQYWVSCGTSICAGSFDPAPAPSTLGASVVASATTADFTLLQLNEAPPAGSVYMGWNNSPVAFNNGQTLHRVSHPSGAPQAYSQQTVDTSAGLCRNTDRGPWIYSRDVVGATEGGSSGSIVVNGAGEVVGQLTGACGTNYNDVCDSVSHATIDGALAYYWDQVAPFLDPVGCTPSAEVCDNGADDDCDGDVDCADADCTGDPACECTPVAEVCDNGADDDCDGAVDCDDADCDADPACNCTLGQPGDPCVDNADCCSNSCKGRPGFKTCK